MAIPVDVVRGLVFVWRVVGDVFGSKGPIELTFDFRAVPLH